MPNRTALPLIVVGTLLFVGCAGSPLRIALMSPEELKNVTSIDLCDAYHQDHSQKVKAELIERGVIPEDDWSHIDKEEIAVGMTDVSLICSWGKPARKNESMEKWGIRKQWLYRSCPFCEESLVTIDNGKITSW